MATTGKKTVTAVVKFTKGITVSKNYQSVKYEVGIEMPCELGPNGEGFRDAVEKLEEKVNAELRRRKSTDFHGLGNE